MTRLSHMWQTGKGDTPMIESCKLEEVKNNNNADQLRWERDKQWHDLRESAGEWAGDIFLVMSYYFKILSSSMTIEILFTFKELCWFQ